MIKRTRSLLPGAAVCTIFGTEKSNSCRFVHILMITSAEFLAAMGILEPSLVVPVFPPSVAPAGIHEYVSPA